MYTNTYIYIYSVVVLLVVLLTKKQRYPHTHTHTKKKKHSTWNPPILVGFLLASPKYEPEGGPKSIVRKTQAVFHVRNLSQVPRLGKPASQNSEGTRKIQKKTGCPSTVVCTERVRPASHPLALRSVVDNHLPQSEQMTHDYLDVEFPELVPAVGCFLYLVTRLGSPNKVGYHRTVTN